MTIDERLADYVREHWDALLDDAARRCAGADDGEAQGLVLGALTRVALRWRFVAGKDDLDTVVRRALTRACGRRDRRQPVEPADRIQLMDVGFADPGSDRLADPADLSGVPTRPVVADPVAALAANVNRVHRRRLLATSAAVIVVAAVAATIVAEPSSHPAARPAVSVGSAPFPRIGFNFANAVTAGAGYIWTIEIQSTRNGSRSYVVKRKPISGAVEARYRVPATDNQIAYGLGKIWTWRNSNDARRTSIATLDVATGDTESTTSTPSVAIQGVTFTADQAWMVEPEVNEVLNFDGSLTGGGSSLGVTGPQFVVPISSSSVLVAGGFGALRELPGNRSVADPAAQFLTLLAPAPSYGIWVGHDNRLTYQKAVDAAPSVQLTLPFRAGAVTGDPAHGVFVALRSNNPVHHDPYLVYYSPGALTASRPHPTARLDGPAQAESMVADPAGGVVFATNQGTLGRWNPAARAKAGPH